MNSLSQLIAKFHSISSSDQEAFIACMSGFLTNNSTSCGVWDFFKGIRSEEYLKSDIRCLHCESASVIGHGFTPNRVRKYRCKSCYRVFSETTGTPISRKRNLEKFNHYIVCLLQGMTLRECADDVEISLKTSFRWRHSILNGLDHFSCHLENIVEIDETFILHSEKGNKRLQGRKPRKRGGKAPSDGLTKAHVSVFVSIDRYGNKKVVVAGRGKQSKASIDRAIGKELSTDNTVVSDSDRNLAFYLKDRKINHVKLNARKKERVKDKIYHIQHANNLQSKLKLWLRKFKGVASRYLQNYLNLFLTWERIRNQPNRHQNFTRLMLAK